MRWQLRPGQRRPTDRFLGYILAVSLLLNAVPLWWGLPNGYSWAADEILPGQAQYDYKWPAKYPPLHRYVLRAAYSPIDGLQHAGIVASDDLDQLTVRFLIGRLLSVFLATLTIYLVYRCARELFGRLAACFAALIAALGPSFVYYAKTVNLEAPYVFWFILSLLSFLKILRRHRMRDYVVFSLLAAFAICTKDQAYGFYVLCPLPIVASLHAAKGGGRRALLGALFDRRVLVMGLTTITVFAVIHGIPWGIESFRRHVETIIGPASTHYRVYPPTVAGHAHMGLKSIEHVAFVLGWPFFLAALAGMGIAFRQPTARRWSGLLILLISYYASFISVIGYNYVRFFVPVGLVLALSSGAAVAELWRRPWPWPVLRQMLVGAAVLYALLRALAVDAWMFYDTRYGAERWLETKGAQETVLGIGERGKLPRAINVLPWSRFGRYECALLDELDPRFVFINPATDLDPRTFGRFMAGELNYNVAARLHQPSWTSILDISRVHTNLDKIAREMLILEQTDETCVDEARVLHRLEELRQTNDPLKRAKLVRVVLGEDIAQKRFLDDEDFVAMGLSPDRWTNGTAAAGIFIRNRSDRHRIPVLQLRSGDQQTATAVWVDDGATAQNYPVARRSRHDIELAAIAPGGERLFIVWADNAWVPDQRRQLGVRLLSGTWSDPGSAEPQAPIQPRSNETSPG